MTCLYVRDRCWPTGGMGWVYMLLVFGCFCCEVGHQTVIHTVLQHSTVHCSKQRTTNKRATSLNTEPPRVCRSNHVTCLHHQHHHLKHCTTYQILVQRLIIFYLPSIYQYQHHVWPKTSTTRLRRLPQWTSLWCRTTNFNGWSRWYRRSDAAG